MSKYIQRQYQLITIGDQLHDFLYSKLQQKEPYEGWYIGVTSTKIVCRIGCKAGPPHKENVIFSKNLLDLLCHGMRECKVCNPLSYTAADHLMPILENIQKADCPDKQWEKETKANTWLEERHLTQLSRYIRVKRINYLLTHSKMGYHETIFFQRYWTPLGMMIGCFTKQGLCLLEFFDRLMLEDELVKLQKKLKANFKMTSTHSPALKLQGELSEYFSGKRSQFTIPLHLIGSEFQLKVWKILQSIPAGEVWTYQQQANALGDSKAARAVGTANGHNSISIIVPCHRVTGKDGKLTGYGGGLPRKKSLLSLERVHYKTLKEEVAENKGNSKEKGEKRKISRLRFLGDGSKHAGKIAKKEEDQSFSPLNLI